MEMEMNVSYVLLAGQLSFGRRKSSGSAGGALPLFSAQLSPVRAWRELKSDLRHPGTVSSGAPLSTWRLIFGGASLSASLASALSGGTRCLLTPKKVTLCSSGNVWSGDREASVGETVFVRMRQRPL